MEVYSFTILEIILTQVAIIEITVMATYLIFSYKEIRTNRKLNSIYDKDDWTIYFSEHSSSNESWMLSLDELENEIVRVQYLRQSFKKGGLVRNVAKRNVFVGTKDVEQMRIMIAKAFEVLTKSPKYSLDGPKNIYIIKFH